jgi:beta-lactamase regulating signal transducer with metallopeptidase domain
VVGWVLQRWREDREEACDVHALSADGVHPGPYGRVLLKCLQGSEIDGGNAVAVGWPGVMTAAPRSLVHRIESIAQFRAGRRTWVVGGCTALSIALVGLTDQEPMPPRRLWLPKSEASSRVLQADPVAPSV